MKNSYPEKFVWSSEIVKKNLNKLSKQLFEMKSLLEEISSFHYVYKNKSFSQSSFNK